MTEPQNSAEMLQQVAERIARIVRTVWQIVLALALAITLILKVYMLVLTDHQCVGGRGVPGQHDTLHAGVGIAGLCTCIISRIRPGLPVVLGSARGSDGAHRA